MKCAYASEKVAVPPGISIVGIRGQGGLCRQRRHGSVFQGGRARRRPETPQLLQKPSSFFYSRMAFGAFLGKQAQKGTVDIEEH